MKLHREGNTILITWFLFLSILVFLAFYFISIPWLNYAILIVCIGLFFLFAQFFRVPKRTVPSEEGIVIAPADGKVVVIEETEETEYFKDRRIQVSIFMSPLNVHVQWSPIAGEIKYDKYHEGLYLVAWHPKSSTDNERTTIVVGNGKHEILFRQIAGAVARRIKYYVKKGQKVERGQEVGFIKFGSRVDLFFPLGTEINVEIDQKVTGRETVIARLK